MLNTQFAIVRNVITIPIAAEISKVQYIMNGTQYNEYGSIHDKNHDMTANSIVNKIKNNGRHLPIIIFTSLQNAPKLLDPGLEYLLLLISDIT